MQMSVPLVSVIIPIRNEGDHIRPCLEAVLAQNYPVARTEILVVDGRSDDNSRNVVAEYAQRHRHLHLLDNPRLVQAAALNIGIRAALGDIIVRIDGHTVIRPDYVSRCVAYLQQGQADNVGGLMRPEGTSYIGQAVSRAITSRFGVGDAKFHYAEQEQYVDTVYMGAYRRQALLDIGLYDETLAINEDYELNYRLRQAGGTILLSPNIHSIYVPRSSLRALWRQYFQYGFWKVSTLRKHPASLRWRQVVAPFFVAVLAISSLLALPWRIFRLILALASGSYLLANFLASTIAARKGGWQYLPVLPAVFATIHLAWGLGFWYGWLRAK